MGKVEIHRRFARLGNAASRVGLAVAVAMALGLPSAAAKAAPLAATSPSLGAAGSYSILAGSIVVNTGPTTMPGDLGISPSIGVPPHYSGFPPGIVGPPGTIHDADAHAAAAQAANTAAFTFLDQGCDVTYAGTQDLTLVSPLGAGVYCADSFLLTGNLTLSGSGVWIFKSASTLTTDSNSSVTGGDACNVWWRLVSSGTLGSGTDFIGNILALTDITLDTGATLNGRAMAQTGQVSLDANTITGPVCAGAATATNTPTNTPANTATFTPSSTPTNTATYTPSNTPTNTPTNTSTNTPTNTPVNTATNTPVSLALVAPAAGSASSSRGSGGSSGSSGSSGGNSGLGGGGNGNSALAAFLPATGADLAAEQPESYSLWISTGLGGLSLLLILGGFALRAKERKK